MIPEFVPAPGPRRRDTRIVPLRSDPDGFYAQLEVSWGTSASTMHCETSGDSGAEPRQGEPFIRICHVRGHTSGRFGSGLPGMTISQAQALAEAIGAACRELTLFLDAHPRPAVVAAPARRGRRR